MEKRENSLITPIKKNIFLGIQKNTSLKAVEKKDVFTRTQWFIDYLKKLTRSMLSTGQKGKRKDGLRLNPNLDQLFWKNLLTMF